VICLRKAYQKLNKGLFLYSALPDDIEFVHNFQRKQTFYFRAPNVIEVGAGCLKITRTQLLDDLLHMMVHIQNWQRGVTDVTQNQYHRLEFCNGALGVGLKVARHSTRGWGVTGGAISGDLDVRHPTSEALARRRAVYKKAIVAKADLSQLQAAIRQNLNSRPSKQFQFKYVCKCDPPIIARVGRRPDGLKPFKARCNYCNANFVLDQ
jgi:hypothetical protein